jgi:protein O-GlcNAc transferase
MSAPPPAVRAALDHIRAGRLKQAADLLRQHLRRAPDDHNSQFLLGNVLSQQLQSEPAIFALERAAAGKPDDPQRWLALGVALLRGRGPHAAEAALRASPVATHPDVLVLLADTLAAQTRAGEAVPILESVLASQPAHAQALKTLAKVFSTAGRTDEALDLFRRAAEATDFRSLAAYCFQTNYSGAMTPAQVFAPHLRFFERAQKMIPRAMPPLPGPLPGRPLRVAFLSADFQQHSVAYFVEPLLEHLPRDRFRVIALTASIAADDVTARLRTKADEWADASDQDPAAMAAAIKTARPDILIDLGGLTGPARVLAMAHRMARIQATYLGYPNTSAVPNVDFRLVDNFTDPTTPYPDGSRADDFATERLLRLDGCFVCYRPPDDAPPVSPRPDRPLAFGSFNTSHKMSPQCVQLWAGVLRAVPGSSLVLKRKEFADPWIAAQFIGSFGREGIAADRLHFLGKTPSIAEHLAAYAQVDIALDTFPYQGTTTTCEALWMGVPVVSLIGRSHASRVGLSLLSACGLSELATHSPQEFTECAASLASDRTRLAARRLALRAQVAASMLCDGPGFAATFASALVRMWARPTTP